MIMQGLNIVNDSAYLRPDVFISKMSVVVFDFFFGMVRDMRVMTGMACLIPAGNGFVLMRWPPIR